MHNYFAQLFLEYRKQAELTQAEMLDFLCNENPSLSTLDTGTISRWEQGHTTPSLEKRFFILSLINKMDKFFYLEANKISCKNNVFYKMNEKRYRKINRLSLLFLAGDYFNNIKISYSDFDSSPLNVQKYLLNRNASFDVICHKIKAEIGYIECDNNVISFFIHTPIDSNMFALVSGHVTDMMNQVSFYSVASHSNDALFFFDQICLTEECYSLCFLHLYIKLLSNPQYKKLYTCIHDQMHLDIALKLGCTILCTYETQEMVDNELEFSHLVVIDAIKFISNKSVFHFCANIYNKLNRNNPDLLKQLRESNETRSNRFKAYC
ncbi:TPA: helix-turn-helix transcriptional regulator [Photobacterium damselae]